MQIHSGKCKIHNFKNTLNKLGPKAVPPKRHSPYELHWVSIVSSFHPFLYNILPFYCYSYFLKILIMVLTRSYYENMSKEELIQELTNINSSFVNDINAKLTDLSDRFNEFTSKYDKAYSELQQCKSYNSHLLTRII